MNKEFQELYSILNKNQQKAVDSIEGPVMVVAGPGTGKTQILAVRILNILEKTDARPQDILCITYTEAGASEMRNRLLKFLGPDAYRVHIYTFHALCNEIILENEAYFGKGDMQALSDLERLQIIQELYNELPNGHGLKKYKPINQHIQSSLIGLFSFMKKEGLEAEGVLEMVKKFKEELPFREDMVYKRKSGKNNVGDPKTTQINKELKKVGKIELAAQCYPLYQEKLIKNKRFDFEDMILWVNAMFAAEPDILSEYQERFLYILTDEFQDTSGAQKQVLMHLVNYWESPNLFVVGDEDQSIFKFQGANIKNIKELESQYKNNLTQVLLTDNYRSSQPILNVAAKFIDLNSERLADTLGDPVPLVAKGREVVPITQKPLITAYYNVYHETIHIGEQIRDLLQKGVDPTEIAVIYSRHAQSADLIKYLTHFKVPLNVKRSVNVLDEPLVLKLLTILEYVSIESREAFMGEHLLFKLCHFSFFGIPALEIAEHSVQIRKSRTKWRTYFQKINEQEGRDLFSDIEKKPILKVFEDTERWISQVHNYTLPQLLEKIANNSGILSWVFNSEESAWNMQVLHSFFDFIKNENAKNPNLTIEELLQTIEIMRMNNLHLSVSKVQYAENGVNLVTAHSSKGLEFEHVFVLGCQSSDWESKKDMSPFSISVLYNTEEDSKEAKIEESRRLFYVAMTRAKRGLNISYAANKLDGKDNKNSQFIDEVLSQGGAEFKEVQLEEKEVLKLQMVLFSEELPDPTELINKNLAKQATNGYVMSASSLNEYIKCPLSFYFNKLVKVPTAKNEFMAFGSTIHSTLEWYFKNRTDEDGFPEYNEVEEKFIYYLYRNRDAHTEEAFKRRLEYGKVLLKDYLEARKDYFNAHHIVSLEKKISNTEYAGIPITGFIDKIEFNGKNATIVDYKTGKSDKAKAKLKGPSISKKTGEMDEGQDYWRQMVFYRILLEQDNTNDWKYEDSYFDFVEPDDDGKFQMHQVEVTPEDVDIVRDQMTNAYQGILNLEFEKGCNDEKCFWCSFTKEHLHNGKVVSDSLRSAEEPIERME